MKEPNRLSKQSDELGVVWYLIPALWAVAATVGLLMITNWPSLLADPLPPQHVAAPNALSFAPSSGSEYSVPAASEVFTDRPYEVSQHVDQF